MLARLRLPNVILDRTVMSKDDAERIMRQHTPADSIRFLKSLLFYGVASPHAVEQLSLRVARDDPFANLRQAFPVGQAFQQDG